MNSLSGVCECKLEVSLKELISLVRRVEGLLKLGDLEEGSLGSFKMGMFQVGVKWQKRGSGASHAGMEVGGNTEEGNAGECETEI